MIRHRNGSCAAFYDLLHHEITASDEIMNHKNSARLTTGKGAHLDQRRPRRELHRLHYASAFRLPPPELSRRTESMPLRDYRALKRFLGWRCRLSGTGPHNRPLRAPRLLSTVCSCRNSFHKDESMHRLDPMFNVRSVPKNRLITQYYAEEWRSVGEFTARNLRQPLRENRAAMVELTNQEGEGLGSLGRSKKQRRRWRAMPASCLPRRES